MEFLVEFLIEFILEGCLDFVLDDEVTKKVPMPLRIVAAVILFAVLIGLGVLFVVVGIEADNVAIWILLGLLFFGLLGGLIWKVRKVFKKRNGEF